MSEPLLPLTESRIQDALARDLRSSAAVVAPNYTPADWWECDVFAITKAGYFTEYEVKLSVSDFRADAGKCREHVVWGDGADMNKWERVREAKHDRLAARDPKGPSRFWYVVPEGLIPEADVPEWAGLMYARMAQDKWVRFTVVRQAPRLHRQKVDTESVARNVWRCLYYRYWDLRRARSGVVA